MSDNATYLTLRQFILRSGLSESTLRRRVRDGTLVAIQPGGPGKKILFPSDALDRCRTVDATPADVVRADAVPAAAVPAQSSTDNGTATEKALPGRRPGWTSPLTNNY